ncbi:MAG: FlgD immunoglobulin-like domain containing protein, partial [bacterium]
SILLNVAALRQGAVLATPPELHWRIRANPLFDPYRTETPPNPVLGAEVASGRFAFDLPDSHFFYPGDVIHYYCRAASDVGGDVRTSLLPGDTTGFAIFPGDPGYSPLQYPSSFVIEGLPTVFAAEPGAQVPLLFWQDFKGSLENEWFTLLQNLGYRRGIDYDVYRSNAPGQDGLISLGLQAQVVQLTGYDIIIYSAGDRRLRFTACGGSVGEYGPDDADFALLDTWLEASNRQLLITGNQLARSLASSSGPPADFLADRLAAAYDGLALEQLDDQSSPLVTPLPGNSPCLTTEVVAHGGCPDHGQSQQGWLFSLANRRFDAVTTLPSGERILEFTGPAGETGLYPFAAGIYHDDTAHGNRIVFLPCEPSYLLTPSASPGDVVSARTNLVREILTFFGNPAGGNPTAVPEYGSFAVRCHPNPFNPRVVIECRLPAPARLTIKIYNLRGELVQTLCDAEQEAGTRAVSWDGVDNRGQHVASGVYFCETRAGAACDIRKLVMVD